MKDIRKRATESAMTFFGAGISINLLALVLCLAVPEVARAQTDLSVNSSIRNVTVFLNKAQVTREIKARVGPGETNLILSGLTSQLDQQSIQVSGSGNIVIVGIRHDQNYLDDSNVPAKLKLLQDSLEYYNLDLERGLNEKDILLKEEQLILANQKIGGTQQNLTVSELKAMADFYRSRLAEIGLAKMNVEGKIKRLNERISRLKKQIAEQRGYFARNTSEITISVTAKATSTASLEVSYVVSNAGWYPVYDLRAKDAGSPVQLHYKANVFQQTGEAWDNVKLKLSTANPALGGVKPELYTWYLDFVRPRFDALQGKAPDAKLRGVASMPAEAELKVSEDSAESLSNYVSTIQTALNTEFEIALPYSVGSTGKPTTVDIRDYDLDATYQYGVAPKLDRDAFLLAKATGWDELSLLPGEANVFFENTFVGKSFIDPNNIKDTLSISMGRDKRVVVQREKLKDYTTRRTIGANQRDRYGWEIAVRNTKNEPVRITVEDQVPVSKNNQIEVSVDNTGGARYNAETGKLVWELLLKPNETRKLQYGFEVKYPKDQQLPGLE